MYYLLVLLGNQIVISLSGYRKTASIYQQMPAITFYLNQLVVTQDETLAGRQIDEWFDGLLQVEYPIMFAAIEIGNDS